jgi:hypothetical protein
MYFSQHAGQRMSQRGISRRLVEFTLRHGRIDGDKHVLDRKASLELIDALNEELRLAKQALEKGGVTVVEGDDTIITVYNKNMPPPHGRSCHAGHR